jgi:hypothetical protein
MMFTYIFYEQIKYGTPTVVQVRHRTYQHGAVLLSFYEILCVNAIFFLKITIYELMAVHWCRYIFYICKRYGIGAYLPTYLIRPPTVLS